MAGPDLARRTSRTGTDPNAVEIERDDLGLGGDTGHRDRGGIWEAQDACSVYHGFRGRHGNLRFQPRTQRTDTFIRCNVRNGLPRRSGEAGNSRNVLRSGTASVLLAAAT